MTYRPPTIAVVEVNDPTFVPVLTPSFTLQQSNTITIKPVPNNPIQVRPFVLDQALVVNDPTFVPVLTPSFTLQQSNTITIEPVPNNPIQVRPFVLDQALVVKNPTLSNVQLIPIQNNITAIEHLTAYRAASTDLECYRAVCQKNNGLVSYLQPTDLLDRASYLGIVLNHTLADRPTTIVIQGIMINQTWSWVPGLLYCTTDGVLTQNNSNLTFQVGYALSATDISVGRVSTSSSSNSGSGTVPTLVWEPPFASTLWTIPHGLGRYPSVTVVDSAHQVMFTDVSYPNINTVIVEFTNATGGYAYLV